MKKLVLVILLVVFTFAQAQEGELKDVELILIGDIKTGAGAVDIPIYKVDAGLNLAGLLTNKYYLISVSIRDSIADIIKSNGQKPTLEKIADSLNVEKIAFATINKLHNMLRMEVVIAKKSDANYKSKGVGYDLINYRTGEDIPIYDPSILRASQRALAVALKDSNLYAADSLEKLRTYPVPTLVIGGIEYKDNSEFQPKWEIFSNSVVTSYDAVETIFEEAYESDSYVTYDIPTRDSIYALYNLYIVENYRPVSLSEIQALNNFEVDYYISGKLERVKYGCNIELTLNKIKKNELDSIRTVKDFLMNDNLDDFRAILKSITNKLLKNK